MRTHSTAGWVLYDETCGVCSRWVPFWAPTLARLGLSPDAVLRDIVLLFNDGRQLAGADVYRYVMRNIWWAYPLYLLSIVPGLRQLFDLGYRVFADNRLRISSACGLRPPEPDPR